MFRIRRVHDDLLPRNAKAIEQVQQILREQFSGLSGRQIAKMPEQLRNPLKYRFRAILYVAENTRKAVQGFALLLHAPDMHFCYLDFIATRTGTIGRGIGGALYQRVRDESLSLKTIGLFFECLPDDPSLCRDVAVRKQNKARLRFYERYGARPLANTAYETPLSPDDDNPPYLVFDNLGQDRPLRMVETREIVRAILERKYGTLCPGDYISTVVDSIREDPVRLREARYVKGVTAPPVVACVPRDKQAALVINDRHEIHHVHERGYVESPVRIRSILRELEGTNLFHKVTVQRFGEKHIRAVHDSRYVDYFKKVCENLQPGRSIYPYVFPIRNMARPPRELAVRAGYYCIDTFTPLNRNAFLAAKRAADCALTAANIILEGHLLAYALVRPPGHHAERQVFGGFCYFNSTAVAANCLREHGKVAIVDIDYHHGNGQQDIFYDSRDVLTVSIHGHPSFAYPYFSGFAEERGAGPGLGFNKNLPLPETVDGQVYLATLSKALKRVERFRPNFLVLALGLDTARGDPTGTWSLSGKDFQEVGRKIGSLRLPTVVVQEGGYNNRHIGLNAYRFFLGLAKGTFGDDFPGGRVGGKGQAPSG